MKYMLFILLLKLSIGKAQVQQAELLIKAEIVGKGKYNERQTSPEGYFVRLVITNSSNLNKVFWIYRCSWPELWFIDRPNTFLYYPGCDSNYPVNISLSPGQETIFYGFVVEAALDKAGSVAYVVPGSTVQNAGLTEEVKFAFAEISDDKFLEFDNTQDLLRKGMAKIYWSNPVKLAFHNSSYKVLKPIK